LASSFNIDTAKDKEACSLLLLMDLLNENGTCCAVLKEGVFFDGKYSCLRGTLIENYNITDIISVPQNAFENTSTKTSIIKFTAGSPTKKIKFSELIVEVEENDVFEIKEDGKVHLTKNKGEIKEVSSKVLCHATYKQLTMPTITKNKKGEDVQKMEYSLNYKNYNTYQHFIFTNDYKLEIPENYMMLKLGDALDFIPKSKHKASIGTDVGKYRFYTSSDTIKFSDVCDIDDNKNKYLIFGTGGNGSLFIDNEFSCSTDNLVAFGKKNIETEYIYYYIKNYWTEFIKFNFNGSTMGHIKKENLINI
jgi:type I restriction-modification system DNA methylase subunit